MKQEHAKKLLLVCLGLFIGLGLAELALRIGTAVWSRRVPGKRYIDAPAVPGIIRMAVLGGSTSDGTPYSNITGKTAGRKFNLLSVTGFLLEQRYGADVEIDNYAGPNWSAETTINHYFERPGPKPDVLVLYTGQNETTRYYSPNMTPSPEILFPLARLRVGSLLLRRMFTSQMVPADQRYTGSLFSENIIPSYEREHNLERYRLQVERLIRHARAEGILLVLFMPQSNYLFPPTRSVYSGPASRKAEALQLFKQAWKARYMDNELDKAKGLLEQISSFCGFSDLFYALGEMHYAIGDYESALPYLRQARETDGFPVCITEAYRRVLLDLALKHSVPYIDMNELIMKEFGRTVPDYDSFFDDCHLHSDVYLALSRKIVRIMLGNGFAHLESDLKDLDISAGEWADRLGITPEVERKALLWAADYHVRQTGYSFLKLRNLKQAERYLARIRTMDAADVSSDLAGAESYMEHVIREEYVRMRHWVESDGDTPLGAPPAQADIEPDFGDEVEIAASQGDALLTYGEVEAAMRHYRAALQINPEHVRSRIHLGIAANSLSWQLATAPDPLERDGERAVMLAEEGCRITGYQVFESLDTLAAAYAEAGRFDDAVNTATRALELARQAGSPHAAAIEQRLAGFIAKRPWREAHERDK